MLLLVMKRVQSVYIIDDNGLVSQIKGGINISRDDGHIYRISEDGSVVVRFDEDGLIDGQFQTFSHPPDLSCLLDAATPSEDLM